MLCFTAGIALKPAKASPPEISKTSVTADAGFRFRVESIAVDNGDMTFAMKLLGDRESQKLCEQTFVEGAPRTASGDDNCENTSISFLLTKTGTPSSATIVKTSMIFPSTTLEIDGKYRDFQPWSDILAAPLTLTFYGADGADQLTYDDEMMKTIMKTTRTKTDIAYHFSNMVVSYCRLGVDIDITVDFINERFSPFDPKSESGITKKGSGISANGKIVFGGGGLNYAAEKKEGDKPIPQNATVVSDTKYIHDYCLFKPFTPSQPPIQQMEMYFSSPILRIEYFSNDTKHMQIWERKIYNNYSIRFTSL